MILDNITLYFKKATTPISIMEIDTQNEIPLHSHVFHELVVIVSGRGIHFTETDRYYVESGDVFLVKPKEAHGYGNTEKLKLINILYLPERMPVPPMDMLELPGYHAFFLVEPNFRRRDNFRTHLRFSSTELAHLLKIIYKIKQEIDNNIPGNEYMTVSLFMQMQCFISRAFFCKEREDMVRNTALRQISHVISYMQTHYNTHITLRSLAEKANMSVSSLNRAFVIATGKSPIDYLLKLRISKAMEIMRFYPDKDISEISYQTGFNDSNYFTRQFKKHIGLAPSQYKKNLNPQRENEKLL